MHKEIFRSPTGAMRVNRNDVEQAGDGGMVSVVADVMQDAKMFDDQKLIGLSLTFNFRRDDPMKAFPYTKDGMAGKRYTLVLFEEPDPVPPTT